MMTHPILTTRASSAVLASFCAVAATAFFGAGPASAGVGFQGLDDLAGGGFLSEPHSVSGDGSTVVGRSTSASGSEGFRWTAGSGMVGLGDLPGGTFSSDAVDVSYDGSVVVGYGLGAAGQEATRWTAGSGWVGLGELAGGGFGSVAFGVSADGSTVVGGSLGANGYEAARWTSGGGWLGFGQAGYNESLAYSVSADGSKAVGLLGQPLTTPPPPGLQGFQWTMADGIEGLGFLPGGSDESHASRISADGTAIVGFSDSPAGRQAYRWTLADGMIGLGDLPGGEFGSGAVGTSADGSIVVGYSDTDSGSEAFIWDQANGMRNLRDLLVSEYGIDLTGWSLTFASDVSDDGLTIVGTGINPSGETEGWIATIPEPTTAAILAVGALAALRRRRTVSKSLGR
jgi:probable HAF family extracellular repeat protein